MAGSVLVTGATGFVAGEVISQLRLKGIKVRGLFRERPCGEEWPGFLTEPEKFTVPAYNGSVDVGKAVRDVSAIVHLAARVHVMKRTPGDAAEFENVNVDFTVNLAKAAAAAGVKRFVFVSSIKACRPEGDEDHYSRTKAQAEKYIGQIAQSSSMEYAIVRPPLVYGPGVKANFLALMKAVHRGIPLPLGAIRNKRSLVGVRNLSDLICRSVDHPGAAGKVFYAGDGEDLSTPELVRKIAAALGKRAFLVPVPPALLGVLGKAAGKEGAIDRLCSSLTVDINDSRLFLGWVPPYSVEEEMRRTAEWFLKEVRR